MSFLIKTIEPAEVEQELKKLKLDSWLEPVVRDVWLQSLQKEPASWVPKAYDIFLLRIYYACFLVLFIDKKF